MTGRIRSCSRDQVAQQISGYSGSAMVILVGCTTQTGDYFLHECAFRNIYPFFMPRHDSGRLLLFGNFTGRMSRPRAGLRCRRNEDGSRRFTSRSGGRDCLQHSNAISTSGNHGRSRGRRERMRKRTSDLPARFGLFGRTKSPRNQDYTVNQSSVLRSCNPMQTIWPSVTVHVQAPLFS
jgi:hypothetical protein